jgi:leucyl/phenylalanyl-tRNA--protein transferase
MFSLESNASKVAFSHLVRSCRTLGVNLIDCQMPNPHLRSLGAEVLPRTTFLGLLADFADSAVDWAQLAGPLPAWDKDARSSS